MYALLAILTYPSSFAGRSQEAASDGKGPRRPGRGPRTPGGHKRPFHRRSGAFHRPSGDGDDGPEVGRRIPARGLLRPPREEGLGRHAAGVEEEGESCENKRRGRREVWTGGIFEAAYEEGQA